MLEGIRFLVNSTKNREEIKKDYEQTLEQLGFDIPQDHFIPGEDKENIIAFIEGKKAKQLPKMNLVLNINYYYTHGTVPMPIMIQLLGTLLDNAIDTKTTKPVLVDMAVTSAILEISVSNASEKKSPTEISRMFKEGVTTKEGVRGFGLANLKQTVEQYRGEVVVSCVYNEAYKSYYLTFKVLIKS